MNATPTMTKSADSSKRPVIESLEFLSYCAGSQEYGIDMRAVRELRPYRDVTRIADGDKLLEGVVMSRGIIMPVVDLRLEGKTLASNDGRFPILIVLSLFDRALGLVVDKVADVVTVNVAQVTPAPLSMLSRATDYLIGVGELGARKLILLDIEKLMAHSMSSLPA